MSEMFFKRRARRETSPISCNSCKSMRARSESIILGKQPVSRETWRRKFALCLLFSQSQMFPASVLSPGLALVLAPVPASVSGPLCEGDAPDPCPSAFFFIKSKAHMKPGKPAPLPKSSHLPGKRETVSKY